MGIVLRKIFRTLTKSKRMGTFLDLGKDIRASLILAPSWFERRKNTILQDSVNILWSTSLKYNSALLAEALLLRTFEEKEGIVGLFSLCRLTKTCMGCYYKKGRLKNWRKSQGVTYKSIRSKTYSICVGVRKEIKCAVYNLQKNKQISWKMVNVMPIF